jgi:hypothetical protein
MLSDIQVRKTVCCKESATTCRYVSRPEELVSLSGPVAHPSQPDTASHGTARTSFLI